MGKVRFLLALWAAKASIPVLKLTKHNATNYPGQIAVNICPDFLKYVGKPKTITAITGTNGKTTVSNMVCDMLELSGKKVLDNRAGANTRTGIATILVKGVNLFGKSKYEYGVFEIDERSSLRIYPYMTPDYILVTNLSRDSIMRNAHPEYIAGLLTEYFPKESKLILNADDLISSGISPENARVYFGIDRMASDVNECTNLINDMRICPKCSGKLKYDYLRYHHIGKAHCEDCGFSSPEYTYKGSELDLEKKTVKISDQEGEGVYKLVSDSVMNIYNMVAATAVLRELGMTHEEITGLFAKIGVTESRFKVVEENGVKLLAQLAKEKNAFAISRTFDYISNLPGKKSFFLMMNCLHDERDWSENVCWMYDCDFEFLKKDNIEEIVVAGPRAKDYRLRLLFAGVEDSKIKVYRDELEGAKNVRLAKGETLAVLYGTDSIALSLKVRNAIIERMKAM